MATTAAASMPPTMNGLGIAPSSTSSSTASAPMITPATPALISNTIATHAVVANSPFQSAPSKQPTPSINPSHVSNTSIRTDSSSSSSSAPTNGALPTHPHHDTTSIIGKRKRADSSPVKESQTVTTIPPAQKQQLLADFRRAILASLIQYDAGISLLDKPVSPEPTSHEAKKFKSPNPDGLQTLRQRLLSDSFYQSLNTLTQDVNRVANEALEALGLPTDIAPEDEMRDDDVHVKDEAGDVPGKIKKFKQVAQALIAQALSQHPYLNVPDDPKSPDLSVPDDISLDQFRPWTNSKLSIIIKSGNKSYYQTLRPKDNKAKPPKESQDEMDVDDESDELDQSDLPPQAEIVRIYQNTPRESVRMLKDAFPSFAKIPTGRREKKSTERKSQDKGLEAPDWLYYGPFYSFAPTHDQGRATISVHTKSQHWFSLHGEKELRRIRAGAEHEEPDEEAEFKDLCEKYEPIPIDPALFEDESENDKALRGISDVLSELRLKQENRLIKHNNPTVASKPDRAEAELHLKSLNQLAELVGKLEPGVYDALDKFLDSLPTSEETIKIHPMPGTLPDTTKVAPPPVPQPTPQYTTTRVSYGGNDIFSPTARVVSGRSQGHNQYTNRTNSFSQQPYPQTPMNRQAYAGNAGYYPQQAAYTQPRPPIPVTPQQYAASGYTNSPFSRNATATVPRMSTSSSSGHPSFVQQTNPSTPFQATIRQTSFITQGTGHGPAQVQTGRRVSLAPQQPQTPVRPPSGQGQVYAPYTPGHNQHTFTAHQTQQQILRVQQQQTHQQPQPYAHTPSQQQQQFAYNQQARQMQHTPQRAPYPPNGGYPQTPQVRVIQQTQPGQPTTPR